MAISKIEKIKRIRIDENKNIIVQYENVILKNGKVISKEPKKQLDIMTPLDDYTNKEKNYKDLSKKIHTKAVKDKYQAKIDKLSKK